MMTGSALPVQTLAPGRAAAVDRFLARLAALSAGQWGRLDALAERLDAGDPISRWRRAEWQASFAAGVPAVEAVVRGVVFGRSLLDDLLRRAPAGRDDGPFTAALGAAGGVGAARLDAQLRSLVDLCAAQPGERRGTLALLASAVLALHARDTLPPRAFARLYEPVAPVLPLAEVDP